MDDRSALGVVIADLVRSVAGVSVVYSSAPVVVALAASVAGSVVTAVSKVGDDTEVVVRDEPEGLAISLTIGVAAGAAAAEVCRNVYDAIADYLLTSAERPPASISVKVGRIG